MKLKFLTAFLIIGLGHAVAQKNEKEAILILTVAPLALIDIYDGASFRAGGELFVKKNISVALHGGTYIDYLKATKIDPKGFLIKPSVRYYMPKKKYRRYLALEYMHKEQEYAFVDKLVVNEVGQEMKYGMSRKVHALNFKYGKIVNLGRHFILDWYLGVGVRKIKSANDLSDDQQQFVNSVGNECTAQENLIRQTGNLIYPDFQLGLKLGFKAI